MDKNVKHLLKTYAVLGAIGITTIGAAIGSIVYTDFYKRNSIEKNLSEKAMFVTGDNHIAYMRNQNIDSDSRLESTLHLITDTSEKSFLIEKYGESYKLIPYHINDGKVIREE